MCIFTHRRRQGNNLAIRRRIKCFRNAQKPPSFDLLNKATRNIKYSLFSRPPFSLLYAWELGSTPPVKSCENILFCMQVCARCRLGYFEVIQSIVCDFVPVFIQNIYGLDYHTCCIVKWIFFWSKNSIYEIFL